MSLIVIMQKLMKLVLKDNGKAAVVASPAGVIERDIYSSSNSGPSKGSLPPVPVAPMRSRVASRPSSPSGLSSPTTSTLEIHTTLILPAPPTIVAPSTDIISPIGFDRKEDGWTLTFSSLGIEIRLYIGILHQLPPLLIHLHPRDSFIHHLIGLHEVARPFAIGDLPSLSAMYPSTTSESSTRDSSSDSSARPSRKRCRSPIATVPLPIPFPGALEHTRADFCYLVRDIEADTEVDAGIGIEVGVEVVSEYKEEYEVEFGTRGIIEIRMDIVIEPVVVDDIFEPTSKDYHNLISANGSREVMLIGLDVAMHVLYDHIHEILVDKIMDIKAGQRQLEAESMIASEERELVCLIVLWPWRVATRGFKTP
nr:hypothetical protein [Tanacetum cinerariifolium]